jgi:hypothetical protein
MIRPSAGPAEISGVDAQAHPAEAHWRVAYVPEEANCRVFHRRRFCPNHELRAPAGVDTGPPPAHVAGPGRAPAASPGHHGRRRRVGRARSAGPWRKKTRGRERLRRPGWPPLLPTLRPRRAPRPQTAAERPDGSHQCADRAFSRGLDGLCDVPRERTDRRVFRGSRVSVDHVSCLRQAQGRGVRRRGLTGG